jgi:hypothetical protein
MIKIDDKFMRTSEGYKAFYEQVDKLRRDCIRSFNTNLIEKYKRFHYEICDSYKGTKELDELKASLSTFENNIAPIRGIIPSSRRYILEKTALEMCYASSDLNKSNLIQTPREKDRFVEGFLTTYGYNNEEIKSVQNRLHKEENKRKIIEHLRMKRRMEEIRRKSE